MNADTYENLGDFQFRFGKYLELFSKKRQDLNLENEAGNGQFFIKSKKEDLKEDQV